MLHAGILARRRDSTLKVREKLIIMVRERAKKGDLPYVRLDGGALAFELADVQNFACARRIACNPLVVVPEAA
jgi:hypothetical protein